MLGGAIMGDLLGYLLSWDAWWLWLLLFLVVALVVYARHDSSFALTDLSYTFPLVGKLRRFARDYSKSSNEGWLNVENTLCRDYAKHMSALSPREFDNNILYLKKSYDHGRRPMPHWAMALLAFLVILESLGFSFMLSTLMVTEGTENQHNLLTLAIVLVLAAILVWVTHAAGHQLYRTGLLRSCFREYQAHDDLQYSSQIVSLDDNQATVDQEQPAHVQCANRVVTRPDDRGTYWWVVLALFLILAIAVGSTKLRIETLHSAPADGGAFISDIFNVDGDQAAAAPAASAEDPATANAREQAALTGFLILAVIFMVTQFVGMSLGYWYGFAGKQSKAAYRTTHGAADYKSYFEPVQRMFNVANMRLYTLHRLLEQHSPRPLEFLNSFIDFIREERARGATDLQEPPGDSSALAPTAPLALTGPSATPDEAPATPPMDEAQPAPESGGSAEPAASTGDEPEAQSASDDAAPEADAKLLEQWDLASDRDAKARFVGTLDRPVYDRLLVLLAERKAKEAERDDLLDPFKDFL